MNAFIKLIGLLFGLVFLAGCATEVGVTYYDPYPPVYYGWYGGYYGPYYWSGPVVVYGHPHGWHGNYHGGPRYVAPPPPHRVVQPAPTPRVTPAPPPHRVVPAPTQPRQQGPPAVSPRGQGQGQGFQNRGQSRGPQGPPQRP